jgi:peptidoglycan/xylan/chitin deacetylase (PgdA/CDA1 family)
VRNALTTGAGLGLGAAALWCAPAAAPIASAVADAFDLPRRVPGAPGVVLTFDDGPHAEGTPAILEVLRERRATATFFLVGEQVERLPALTAEIVAAGHEIALHGFRHVLLLRRSVRALADDLERAVAAIEDAADRTPALYRPPYGVFSLGALHYVRPRWEPLLWSQWGRDWRARATAEDVAAHATQGLKPGDVVLLHDADHYSSPGSWRITAAALPFILDAVDEIGTGTTPARLQST